MLKYLLPFALAFFLSYYLTPVARKLAIKVGAIDVPKDNRRVHKKPTPRMGGLSIYLSFIIVMFIFSDIELRKLVGILLGSTMLVIMGMIDDVKPLGAKLKLVLQIIAALILIYFGFKIEFLTNFFDKTGYIFLSKFSIPITVIWIVGVTNTINLVDGLDGLATGISTFAAITFAYVSYLSGNIPITIISIILVGASLGFLPYNFNPASIFMGDTGAYFLGFVLAAISVEGTLKGTTAIAVFIPVLALGLPIFDTAFAIIRRFINKKPIFQADKGHFHHRLLHIGMNQRKAVLMIYFISILMNFTAIALVKEKILDVSVLVIITIILLFVPIIKTIGMEKTE